MQGSLYIIVWPEELILSGPRSKESEDIPVPKEAEEINANHNDFTVIEEEDQGK